MEKFLETWNIRLTLAKDQLDCFNSLVSAVWSQQTLNPKVLEAHVVGIRKAWPLALEGVRTIEEYLAAIKDLVASMNKESSQQDQKPTIPADVEIEPPDDDELFDPPSEDESVSVERLVGAIDTLLKNEGR